jgi:D-tyrosyl-tRNA(Tyr) deacylase
MEPTFMDFCMVNQCILLNCFNFGFILFMLRTVLLTRDKYTYSAIVHKYDIKVCTSRTKVMEICKGNAKKTKIEIHGNVVQQASRMVLEVKRNTGLQLQK